MPPPTKAPKHIGIKVEIDEVGVPQVVKPPKLAKTTTELGPEGLDRWWPGPPCSDGVDDAVLFGVDHGCEAHALLGRSGQTGATPKTVLPRSVVVPKVVPPPKRAKTEEVKGEEVKGEISIQDEIRKMSPQELEQFEATLLADMAATQAAILEHEEDAEITLNDAFKEEPDTPPEENYDAGSSTQAQLDTCGPGVGAQIALNDAFKEEPATPDGEAETPPEYAEASYPTPEVEQDPYEEWEAF